MSYSYKDGDPSWGQRGSAAVAFAARLSVRDVHYAYQKKHALRGISLEIEPSEVICLLGESGCGKSTLLRCIAGIEKIDEGDILINNEIVSNSKFTKPAELRNVGLVFQDYALFPHLTVLQNIMFGLRSLAKNKAKFQAETILSRVGLSNYGNQYPHMLSGGEQQRIALARAIVARPSILLLDEPFSGLDSRLRDHVREETLTLIRETRSTCIVVTHDPEEALRMADRIVLMDRGQVIQVGSPEDMYSAPKNLFVAGAFSDINVIDGVLKDDYILSPLGPVPILSSMINTDPGTQVKVAIRTQGFRLQKLDDGCLKGAIKGRVLSHRYLGMVDALEIGISTLENSVRVLTRKVGDFKTGDDVFVSLIEDDVLVFPASSP